MLITFKQSPTDPVHPMMHGTTPTAKEFNRRQAKIWAEDKFTNFDFEQVATVLLEMFADDYNKRHAPRKRTKK